MAPPGGGGETRQEGDRSPVRGPGGPDGPWPRPAAVVSRPRLSRHATVGSALLRLQFSRW